MGQTPTQKSQCGVLSMAGPKSTGLSLPSRFEASNHETSILSDASMPEGANMITYEEVAARMQVSVRTVKRLVARGVIKKIPHMRYARFYWADVVADLRKAP